MENLVTSLLMLARCESGQFPIEMEMLGMGDAVTSAWKPFADKAASRGLHITCHESAGLYAKANPLLLHEVLSNLFSNAVEYTTASGSIEVTVTETGNSAAIRIANTVQDLEAHDIQRMFDRFWRKESARSDNHHTGLGLALARGYANAMGWELSSRLIDASWLEIILRTHGSTE